MISFLKLMEISAAIMGFIGTIFLTRGVLGQTPQSMLLQVSTFVDLNIEQLNTISKQKADYMFGFILISISFAIQVIILLADFVVFEISCTFIIFSTSIIILLLVIILLFILNMIFRKYNVQKMKNLYVKNYLSRTFKDPQLTKINIDSIKQISCHLCDFDRRTNETDEQFLNRLSKFLDIDIPDDINFSDIN